MPVIIQVSLGFVQAYVVKQQGVMIFDTGTPGSEQKIITAMQERGIQPEEVTIIVLSHGHADHAGSARALHDSTHAPIVSHVLESDALRKGTQGPLHPITFIGTLLTYVFNRKKMAGYPPVEPDICIQEPFDLIPYGIEGSIIPTPGHTKGSLSVALLSGERFVGDLIFPTIPSGKPGKPFWADEPEALQSSVKRLMEEPSTLFYTGHGGPFSSQDVNRIH